MWVEWAINEVARNLEETSGPKEINVRAWIVWSSSYTPTPFRKAPNTLNYSRIPNMV